ncbi:MAG: hypothetical protein LRY53_07130 [Burkholderiaceae bacterium]|nr:hypothetical protein [Burkholderiaceae bacterium]MCD8515789.1 hypothetical protein [Burkholderiaceae bacterium]MCD8537042.1 hypothetical protein [Burkholderiaceae bacterium]MCD8565402.1 hypothetical protein [Burkholderiaceae bacterium]
MNFKYLPIIAFASVLAGCAATTATALNKADGTIELVSTSSSEDDALEATLDKGIQQCKATGKTFAVIDRQSTYRGIDPNVRAAINVASILTKGAFSGAGRSSDDWRVIVIGKCQ